ncbi:MAG: bis(5'-nucleosyl)-tetraphosphatase (symmetrical) YqeK [Lachnospiraceae bacterium]|nr:bis(5'-nucleosyl)-tetraphosphatase (symmetrical) YqeK [Lachnospiraceae bacterium]
MTEQEIKDRLKKTLKKKRYQHTIGVAETAKKLAEHYGEDPDRAYLAGLLHDCAKNVPKEERIALAESYGCELSSVEKRQTGLIHAKLGAAMAKKDFGVEDEEILSAIRCHTVGRPGMTLLEEIIFVADYIEPNREGLPHLDQLREKAYTDLDACVVGMLENTFFFIAEGHGEVDEQGLDTYLYYSEKVKA